MRVLARAYKDEPLDRKLVGQNERVFYVAHPSTVSSTGICESGGVGFPKQFVFEFDSELFDTLHAAWESRDAASLEVLWSRARPLANDHRIAA